jgi:hypothetical protein
MLGLRPGRPVFEKTAITLIEASVIDLQPVLFAEKGTPQRPGQQEIVLPAIRIAF